MRIRLRQIVLVAADLTAAERRIEQLLGVERCFRDPGVAEFGLRNALFPIGDQFVEVVSPTRNGTTAGRLLDKRGDGGYMVIVEVDDLDAFRHRVAEHDVRIVYEAVTEGIVGLHLHPADVGGAILSVDRTDTWGEWPWAGPAWRNHVRTERVTDVLAVVVEAHEPMTMAATWAAVLGCQTTGDRISLPDGGELRFARAGDRGEGVAGFVLAASDPSRTGTVTICNCRFDIV